MTATTRGVRTVKPIERWPTGDSRTIGIVSSAPDEITARFGIRFERGLDGLGEYALAAISDRRGGQFWLFRYDGSPFRGTDVVVDALRSRSDTLKAVRTVLGFQAKDFEWISDDEYDQRTFVQDELKKRRLDVDRLSAG